MRPPPPGNTELVPTTIDTYLCYYTRTAVAVFHWLVWANVRLCVCGRVGATPLARSVIWNIPNFSGTSLTKWRQVRGSGLRQTSLT